MFKWLKERDRIWLSGWFGGALAVQIAMLWSHPVTVTSLCITVVGWLLFTFIRTRG